MEKNKMMKKLLLILFCLPLIGFGQIVNLNLTVTNTTGVLDITNKRTLVKITDILGQKTPYRKNIPLLYIYDDGTVEKKIILE